MATSRDARIGAGDHADDGALLDRVQGGDRAAFTALVRRHDPRLRGLAYRLLAGDRDRMDDALQDAYLRAFAALGNFRREADFGSWLYRIAYNSCIDALRRARRRPEPLDPAAERWNRPDPSIAPTPAAASHEIARALASLSEAQRVTVVLVDGEGFDHQSAAEILGVAPGTVASRLSRARSQLRHALERPALERPPSNDPPTEASDD
jgi:RNA polymerase sigma-70 factor (ECF subfamily)